MDPDPMQFIEDDNDKNDKATDDKATDDKAKPKAPYSRAKLNTMVAVSVALLATFTGICKIKDDNIVQAMQQAQADKVDNYTWYQARNVREEVARATAVQLTLQASTAPPQAQATYQEQIKAYQALARDQAEKKKEQQADAAKADKTYNDLNYHDDQFDLSDAMLALAISLLALTALTQKRWLFFVAMVPTAIGVVMGLAGLIGWRIHSDFLARLLS